MLQMYNATIGLCLSSSSHDQKSRIVLATTRFTGRARFQQHAIESFEFDTLTNGAASYQSSFRKNFIFWYGFPIFIWSNLSDGATEYAV